MVTVHVDQDAVLSCEVEGDSSPAVMWRKDGFPLPKHNDKYDQLKTILALCDCILYTLMFMVISFRYTAMSEGSLHIHRVQLSDAGRYYCTASNQAGSDHQAMDLRVFGKSVKSQQNYYYFFFNKFGCK